MFERCKNWWRGGIKEGWHPAEKPYTVAVKIYMNGTTDTKYIHYEEDNWLHSTLLGPYVSTAKGYAESKASYIRKNGFREVPLSGTSRHFPVHRIKEVDVYPKVMDRV